MGHLLHQKISAPNKFLGVEISSGNTPDFSGVQNYAENGKLLLQNKNDFFKLFDQEAVLSVIYANPRSWGCKKVSGIDPTYSDWAQRPPSASVIDSRPKIGHFVDAGMASGKLS